MTQYLFKVCSARTKSTPSLLARDKKKLNQKHRLEGRI